MISIRHRMRLALALKAIANDIRFPVAAAVSAQRRVAAFVERIAARIDKDDRACIACGAPGGTHRWEECSSSDDDRYTCSELEFWKFRKAERAREQERGAT
jgi:hypothetical protein